MAIAFDASSGSFVNPGTSHTVSHTCTGSDRYLVVNVVADSVSDLITGVTYNSVAMTQYDKDNTEGRWHYIYVLSGPSTGTNNIVASASSSCFIEVNAASYTGVNSTGQPEAAAESHPTGSGTSASQAVTTVTDNAWVVGCVKGQGGSITAGSGTTLRNTSLIGAVVDSGSAVTPAGSKTLTANMTSGERSIFVIALAPAGGGGGSNVPLNTLVSQQQIFISKSGRF